MDIARHADWQPLLVSVIGEVRARADTLARREVAELPTRLELQRQSVTVLVGARLGTPDLFWFAAGKVKLGLMDTTNEAAQDDNANVTPITGSKDGDSAADNDEPYRFGRRPSARAPYPFTERQYARLLILKGRMQDRAAA
jgi:hypothetical protein